MSLVNGFDANEVEPNEGFDVLPVGDYLCAIVDSEEKRNSKNTGSLLSLTVEVIDGKYSGRKLWVNLNLDNPNQEAVKIARAELSAICRAVNVMKLNAKEQLHDIPFIAKIGIKNRTDTGEPENKIKKFSPRGQQSTTTTAAGTKKPWER